LPAAMSLLSVVRCTSNTEVSVAAWPGVCSIVVCSVLYVVRCRLHAVGCMLHVEHRGLLHRRPLQRLQRCPSANGAGPRLHFVALRPIERGEVRYE
jgi:hypothetical protein